MTSRNGFPNLSRLLTRRPQATAILRGSPAYPSIEGNAAFHQTPHGILVATRVRGLPTSDAPCEHLIFALHIHGGRACTGNETDPFADAGTHYDPYDCPHPYHAGDLPPLFDAGGIACSAVLTDRFTLREILGKTLILHASPDDFTSQPSGNAGQKIACGVITPTR